AVNKKEKRRGSYKEDGATHHPRFIGSERRNLLCRKKGQADAERRGEQATESGNDKCLFAVAHSLKVLTESNFEQRAEHVKKRNELQDDGERQHALKGFLDAGADEIH